MLQRLNIKIQISKLKGQVIFDTSFAGSAHGTDILQIYEFLNHIRYQVESLFQT